MWDQALELCLTSLRTLVWSWNKTFEKLSDSQKGEAELCSHYMQ